MSRNESLPESELQADSSDDASLSIMQIHEELDEQGNEIKAEVLDMNEHLRKLLLKQEDDHTTSDATTKVQSVIRSSDTILEEQTQQKNKRQLLKRYDEISKRLDELSLLEDEYENNKVSNQKSSVKLQGTGWSKGFLSTPPKKNKSRNKKNAQGVGTISTSKEEDIIQPVQNTSSSPSLESSTTNKQLREISDSNTTTTPSIKKKSVGFTNKDEIREIPARGGTGSRMVKQMSTAPKLNKNSNSIPMLSSPPSSLQGILKDKPKQEMKVAPKEEEEVEDDRSLMKKKVSRFKQEREAHRVDPK
jgi:hypothetical protein